MNNKRGFASPIIFYKLAVIIVLYFASMFIGGFFGQWISFIPSTAISWTFFILVYIGLSKIGVA